MVYKMPWGYITIISILLGFLAYTVDMMMKMQADIKYIRMKMTS